MLPVLTKSRYIQGFRCEKLAWLAEHLPEALKEDRARALEGQTVGAFARTLYSAGILVEGENAIEKTQLLLTAKVPIFEGTFAVGRLLCKVDILVPTDLGWELIEVKSATDVKPDHKQDVSFQAMLLREAGVHIAQVSVLHVNNEFRKDGPIKPELFFTKELIALQETTELSASLLKVLDGSVPIVPIGSQCLTAGKRSDCPAKSHCWQFLPEHNVMQLYYNKKLGFELLASGTDRIANVDSSTLEGKHIIQHACVTSNLPHSDIPQLRKFIGKFVYPLYFFDVETIGPALPLHNGAKPYQAVPFQFSLHILQASGELTHQEFLAQDDDPRHAFAHALELLGNEGTIVAYNAAFEKSVLKDLINFDLQLEARIASLDARFIDLLVPFKQFHYYHPKQKGSCSIKAVLPALTGISYDSLTISKGDQAASEYYRVTYANPRAEDKAQVREALLRYCELDTLAMVEIYRVLLAETKKSD